MAERKGPGTATTASTERHYSVKEIVAIWGYSRDVVRRAFINEPGVIFSPGERRKAMRIPESVLNRVHQRMKQRAG